MSEAEKKACEAHEADRKLAKKYQTPDNMWMDWYCKGYEQGKKDSLTNTIREAYARGLMDMKSSALDSFINGAEAYDDFERDLEEEYKRLMSEE